MKKYSVLYKASIVTIILLSIMFINVKEEKNPDYTEMYMLAEKSEEAFDAIRGLKDKLGIDYSNHASGMLGPELTGITTTLGSKESKSTIVNPNFAAVVYKYVSMLKLEEGDKIALNLSSSFPALNIETIIVLESLGYEPVIISSLGSSTYGATDINLTYLDMEDYLYNIGIIKHKSMIYTLGGDYDIGSNMNREDIKKINDRLSKKNYTLYSQEDYDTNLEYRMNLYKECKALVNVGGNRMSQTDADIGYFDKYGYLSSSKVYNYDNQGLIGRFLSEKKDVIHLLNVKNIAIDNNMPIDPEYGLELGVGGIYYKKMYRKEMAILILIVFLLSLMRFGYEKNKSINKNIDEIIWEKYNY